MELYIGKKVVETEKEICAYLRPFLVRDMVKRFTEEYVKKVSKGLDFFFFDYELKGKDMSDVTEATFDWMSKNGFSLDKDAYINAFRTDSDTEAEIKAEILKKIDNLDIIGYSLFSTLRRGDTKEFLGLSTEEVEKILLEKGSVSSVLEKISDFSLPKSQCREIFKEREKNRDDLYQMFTNLTDGSYVREQDISGLFKLIGIDFNENDWREIHYSEPLNEWDDWEAYFKLIEPSTFISCLKNQYSNPTAASIVDGLVAKYLLEEDQHLLVDGKEPKELPKVRGKKGQH